MAAPRVFTDQVLAEGIRIALETGPSHHLLRVLRLKAGAELSIFNGRGGCHRALLTGSDGGRAQVEVGNLDRDDRESPLAVTLAIGISRGERMDWIVQKSVELGVAAIQPLITQRTEVRLKGERSAKRLAHWRQIAIAACEQSGRNRVPEIHPPKSFSSTLDLPAELRLVLAPGAEQSLAGLPETPSSLCLLIGPEGGLAAAEIAAAEAAGFLAVGLGPRVLRTETAPLAALAICQARWGDLR